MKGVPSFFQRTKHTGEGTKPKKDANISPLQQLGLLGLRVSAVPGAESVERSNS